MACVQKARTPPWVSRKKVLYGNLREGCRVCNLPLVGGEVTGWCSKNLNHQPSGSNQSGVPVLVLSLKLPSSTWAGPLVPIE